MPYMTWWPRWPTSTQSFCPLLRCTHWPPLPCPCQLLECRGPSHTLSLQFRRALRRPHPAERDYLERQYTGIGLQLGKHSRCGQP